MVPRAHARKQYTPDATGHVRLALAVVEADCPAARHHGDPDGGGIGVQVQGGIDHADLV